MTCLNDTMRQLLKLKEDGDIAVHLKHFEKLFMDSR